MIVKLGAAVILCVLAGTQAERLILAHMKVPLALAKESKSKQSWLPFGLKGIFGGSAVCRKRDFLDGPSAARRYHDKVSKLNEAAKTMLSDFSIRQAEEVKNRLKQFGSCMELAEDASMPNELKELMLSSNESLKSVGANLSLSIIASLKEGGGFPEVGVCGFYPERVDIGGAAAHGSNASRVMSHQLYGSGCDAAAAAIYMAGRTETEQKIAGAQVEVFEELLKLAMGKATREDVAKVAEDLARNAMESEEARANVIGQYERTESSLIEKGLSPIGGPSPFGGPVGDAFAIILWIVLAGIAIAMVVSAVR